MSLIIRTATIATVDRQQVPKGLRTVLNHQPEIIQWETTEASPYTDNVFDIFPLINTDHPDITPHAEWIAALKVEMDTAGCDYFRISAF